MPREHPPPFRQPHRECLPELGALAKCASKLPIGGRHVPPEELKDKDSAAKFGVGIRGTRERIRQLGGTLDIDSSSKGTNIVACVPAPPASASVYRIKITAKIPQAP
jgi:hypothetical protein